jgi:hypothetical protein
MREVWIGLCIMDEICRTTLRVRPTHVGYERLLVKPREKDRDLSVYIYEETVSHHSGEGSTENSQRTEARRRIAVGLILAEGKIKIGCRGLHRLAIYIVAYISVTHGHCVR